MKLCNRTSYVIYAATAELHGGDMNVRGWTRIVPGSCQDAIAGDLTADGYFLYAKSSHAHSGTPRAWSGATNLCVKDNSFSLRAPFGSRCADASYEAPFAPVATLHMRSWTTTFREAPDLTSMQAAERAGLKRLLDDSGVHTSSDKQIEAALVQVRQRMHLAAGAPVFDALETAAMKTAAPAGYTVCNDTNGPLWVAIGQQKGAVFVSKGWWTPAAGSCALLITESVSGQKIWLRAERGKGGAAVSGPASFCVTNIEFEIQGRERCAQRGLVQAGFLETNSKGLPGVVARVTTGGLAFK